MSKIPMILLALNTGLFAAESIYQDGWTDEHLQVCVNGFVKSQHSTFPFPANYAFATCITQYYMTHYSFDYVMNDKNATGLVKLLTDDGVIAKCLTAQLITK